MFRIFGNLTQSTQGQMDVDCDIEPKTEVRTQYNHFLIVIFRVISNRTAATRVTSRQVPKKL